MRFGGEHKAAAYSSGGLHVDCPHCSARYELPPRLLGPGGAAVRCPRCAGGFTVSPEGAPVAGDPGPAPRADAAPAAGATPARPETAASRPATAARAQRSSPAHREPSPAKPPAPERASRPPAAGAAPAPAAEPAETEDPSSDPHAIARRIIEELAARRGPAMDDAKARKRLFAEFGPELSAAFDEFRKQSGGSGNPAPFRAALRERWGIDLG